LQTNLSISIIILFLSWNIKTFAITSTEISCEEAINKSPVKQTYITTEDGLNPITLSVVGETQLNFVRKMKIRNSNNIFETLVVSRGNDSTEITVIGSISSLVVSHHDGKEYLTINSYNPRDENIRGDIKIWDVTSLKKSDLSFNNITPSYWDLRGMGLNATGTQLIAFSVPFREFLVIELEFFSRGYYLNHTPAGNGVNMLGFSNQVQNVFKPIGWVVFKGRSIDGKFAFISDRGTVFVYENTGSYFPQLLTYKTMVPVLAAYLQTTLSNELATNKISMQFSDDGRSLNFEFKGFRDTINFD
jgi:hypothetical protein